MNKFLFVFILIGSVFFTACREDKDVYNPGYEYFPINIGDYKIYQVYKKSYQPTSSVEENFEIKEVVAESFTINNEVIYRLERFKRENSSMPWPVNPDSIWTVSFSNSKIVKTENNIRFVKIVFPVENGQTWNGNIENTWGAETYLLQKVNKSFTVPAATFSNTATVIHSPNDSTEVEKDYRMEVYAKGIGMIYRLKETYEYDQSAGNWGKGIIEVGIKHYERLTSYGKQ